MPPTDTNDPESPPPAPDSRAGDREAAWPPETEAETDESDGEFARLLDAEASRGTRSFAPGDEVSGSVVQIDEQEVFVDCGGRHELPISRAELLDEDGELRYTLGDTLTAYVVSNGGELGLTLALDLQSAGFEQLSQAATSGTPIKGRVKALNKGGLTIDVGGQRGFCPFSQIDLRRVDDPERFLDQDLEFKILELSEDGRNLVLSRRALLQERRESAAQETRAKLKLGDVFEGHVTRLVPFGAFVDIGGVEGLVHISQIAHERVADPQDVLTVGQEIRVQVLEIQNLGQGRRERIGLSMKALAADPWPTTAARLQPGTDVEGAVTRLVDFGVFVQIEPGVEGLVHISEMANRRIQHPREIVSEGDPVSVRILDVDVDRRRISLSLRQSAAWEE
jgi:small subunit ribosomal protein S1